MSPMSDVAPRSAQELIELLPDRLSGAGEVVLDLDRQFASDDGGGAGPPSPPLPFEDGRFDLIFSLREFAGLGQEWGPWLSECERLLSDQGLFVVAIPYTPPRGSPDPGREWIALRKRPAAQGPWPGEGPGGGGLAALLTELDAGRRRDVDELREQFHRELMRKSFRIAELEPESAATPASWAIAERVAASYEATLSWRVTAPIRAAKRALARR